MAPSVTFRGLLGGTTALSVPLILIGIYTAIAGFGLTCEARWPLCDGAFYGLFPANWGSFVEWFHRLIAMVFGITIVGAVVAAWREPLEPRIRLTVTAAAALTPLQIVFGALTVDTYETVVLATHFATAIVIFSLLVAATVWTMRTLDVAPGVGVSALGPAALLALAVPLTPGLLLVHTAGLHVGYYALTLLAFGGLLAAGLLTVDRARWTALGAAFVLATGMVFSRVTLVSVSTQAEVLATLATTLVAIVGAIVVYGLRHRTLDRRGRTGPTWRPN